MGQLSGQVAVVTGAGSGIGQAIASSLMAEGAFVHLVGRTAKTLAATASLAPEPRTARCHPADIAETSAIALRSPRATLLHFCAVHYADSCKIAAVVALFPRCSGRCSPPESPVIPKTCEAP